MAISGERKASEVVMVSTPRKLSSSSTTESWVVVTVAESCETVELNVSVWVDPT